MNRRTFLAASAASGLAAAAPLSLARPARGVAPAGKARNVIFAVVDGMSAGTLTLAEMASRVERQDTLHWIKLWSSPGVRRALMGTFAANSWVTDSAAASTAWGCGVKTNNGVIGCDPTGRQVVPLLVQAAQNGKATGLVTTTRVTHATPAGFIANSPSRDFEGPIAAQTMERKVDVVLGGGGKFFPERILSAHADLTIARTRDELLAPALRESLKTKPRLLGLFHQDHLPYVIDRDPAIPTLAEMSRAALDRLSAAPGGFVLQVEGGRVDHAAHNNDAGALVRDQLEFDDALGVLVEFAAGRDDTLLIVTTDHGTANPGLTLYGTQAAAAFDRLLKVAKSFDWITAFIGQNGGPSRSVIKDAVGHATSIELGERALGPLEAAARNQPSGVPFSALDNFVGVLGLALADHLGVGFVSVNHTSDLVECTALGPGSQGMPPLIENHELHALAVDALGLAPATPLPGMDQPLKLPDRQGD